MLKATGVADEGWQAQATDGMFSALPYVLSLLTIIIKSDLMLFLILQLIYALTSTMYK